jgi:glycine cleavage system H protein
MVALFVLVTILLFVLVDVVVQRVQRRKEALAPTPVKVPMADRFLVPRGYFLSRGHSWIELLFSGNARIGIDDFVQKLVGTIDGIRVAPVRSEIRKGEPLFTISREGRTLSIPSPLSGRIVEVNSELLRQPAALNSDPYVSGWGVVIEPTALASELRLLSIADGAALWLRGEVTRFRNFIKESALRMTASPLPVGVTLLDGGTPVAGVLRMTDEKTWKDFQQEFLSL